MRFNSFLVVFLFLSSACGRKTTSDINTSNEISEENKVADTTLITETEPFRNQPNKLCTIIRKLDISQYEPQTITADPSQFPKKYALLDICLDVIDESAMTIHIGEENETVTTTFKLIKLFESYEEAKAYADKYGISDVKWEE